ncbi:GNAT family N-acetyltransferase [uncultured Oscillibacter sp.]|uniref:GNAT family N-acetyltransferase n=1 Tax=uncultured Oscillibacter sp. TaxID=876091 RepID=UPI00260DF4CD|nr:GNAT family N-acetyltransferase [uncultured Oscillibacter sp.]
MNFKIRRFQERDAAEVSAVIGEALRVSNAPDYPPEIIREMLELYTPENLLEQAGSEHLYVLLDGDGLIGCGGIAPHMGSEKESILVTIFVLPEYQRRSAGRRIMEALERDPYFLRADRVAVHSSITARDFYLRLGYRFSDGVGTPDEEGCIRMEKRR